MTRGGNLPWLADHNQAVVLDLIRRTPGLTRTDLQRHSGLASQTISNITRRLILADLVHEHEPIEGARGRPSIPLAVHPEGAFAVGVHVDPARLTLLLMDVSGQVRHQLHLRTPQATNPNDVTSLIATTAGRMIRETGVDRNRVLGIGIAAPGPLDIASGTVIDPPQLPEWRNVRLRDDLQDATGLPVLLDKDVTAAAAAQLRRGGNGNDFVLIYLGSGVGAAIVTGGRVLRGTTNNIGEIGDIIVTRNEALTDWSGRAGSLAAACVPEALALRAAAAGVIERPALDDYLAIDDACTELTTRSADGDSRARRVLESAAIEVAVGVGVLVNLLDVPAAVFGGPLWSRLEPTFLPIVQDRLPHELIVARDNIAVSGSVIGDHIAAEGAAELVLDHNLAPNPAILTGGRPSLPAVRSQQGRKHQQ